MLPGFSLRVPKFVPAWHFLRSNTNSYLLTVNKHNFASCSLDSCPVSIWWELQGKATMLNAPASLSASLELMSRSLVNTEIGNLLWCWNNFVSRSGVFKGLDCLGIYFIQTNFPNWQNEARHFGGFALLLEQLSATLKDAQTSCHQSVFAKS